MDRIKFREALLYVAWRLREVPEGGAVMLNKVLFYAEFGHMRQFGRTITGARYFKLREGPAPRALLPVRDELITAGEATIAKAPFNGKVQVRLVPTHEPVPSALSEDELRSIEEALVLLAGMNARTASDMSHDELGWRFVKEREDIPFETAFLAPIGQQFEATESMRRRAAELADA